MITYNYTAKNTDGEFISGQIEAQNESGAAKVLMGRKLFPISISVRIEGGMSLFNRISMKSKVLFIRQFATTLGAGLPITQALEVIASQVQDKLLKDVVTKVISDIEGGMALSASFSRFPKVFTRIDIALIESGEASGTLEKVLLRLADNTEKDYRIVKKVRSALIYPAFILVVVGLVLGLMTVYVMPQMEGLYKGFNAQLPFVTTVMINVSHFLANYGILVIAGLAILAGAIRYYTTTPSGRYLWDNFILGIPVISPFLRSLYCARFSRTMGGLVGSGVSLLDSLSITATAVGNQVFEGIILEAAKEVKGGKPLSKPLRESKDFPPIVAQMVNVGEQTGETDKMFNNLADYFDDEIDNFVASLSSILEPTLIVIMGGFVAVILVAIMMPIYNIGSVIK